jgi:hypothetical protein
MESMRSTWTDSRLDDFAEESGRRFDRLEQRMDGGFRDVRAEIGGMRAELGTEIGGVRAEIGGMRAEMHAEIGEVRDRVFSVHQDISGLQRALIQSATAMFGALFGMIVAIIGVIFTQL